MLKQIFQNLSVAYYVKGTVLVAKIGATKAHDINLKIKHTSREDTFANNYNKCPMLQVWLQLNTMKDHRRDQEMHNAERSICLGKDRSSLRLEERLYEGELIETRLEI